jgi:hypothetical protein
VETEAEEVQEVREEEGIIDVAEERPRDQEGMAMTQVVEPMGRLIHQPLNVIIGVSARISWRKYWLADSSCRLCIAPRARGGRGGGRGGRGRGEGRGRGRQFDRHSGTYG